MVDMPLNFGELFDESINAFLKEKHLLGYNYRSQVSTLKSFSDFADKNRHMFNNTAELTKNGVESWLISNRNDKPTTRINRATVIRQFALYQNRAGCVSYVLPSNSMPKSTTDFVPYIFTESQIADILEAADALPPTNVSPVRHLTMPVLFRLLYSCGLRISEALNLKISNIDFENRVITIVDGKFSKDRVVPYSESLNIRLSQYSKTVHTTQNKDEIFFINAKRTRYTACAIGETFHKLLDECGIPRSDSGPRTHDLRHTFAVHCLKRWVNNGNDLNSLLPYLSAYMGHTGLESTQVYTRLTSDLYPRILSATEQRFSYIIPKPQRSDLI